MTSIDRVQQNTTPSTGGANKLPDPSAALALAKQLGARSLDSGTAALVAELVAELGGAGASAPAAASHAEMQFSTSDDFAYGFCENLHSLRGEIAGRDDVKLEITETNRGASYDLTIQVSGADDAVAKLKTEIEQLGRGVTDAIAWT